MLFTISFTAGDYQRRDQLTNLSAWQWLGLPFEIPRRAREGLARRDIGPRDCFTPHLLRRGIQPNRVKVVYPYG